MCHVFSYFDVDNCDNFEVLKKTHTFTEEKNLDKSSFLCFRSYAKSINKKVLS